jgi:AraC-like DNA-binding protein
VRAGAPTFCVVFPADWLALPPRELRMQAASLARILAYYRDDKLPTSTTETVAALLAPLLGDTQGDLDGIARRLAVSRRTLQQRLSWEGSSFRDIALDVRIGRAKEMLLAADAALAEVALSVGYSDQAHFTRAFKTRTGLTPQAFRRRSAARPSASAE